MSQAAMKTSEQTTIALSCTRKPVGRVLALVSAMMLSLSACETMKDTMDSMNIFGEDDKTAGASAEPSHADAASDPRKHAVMRAGVKGVNPEAANSYMDQQEAMLREQLAGTGVKVSRAGDTIILSLPGSKTFASGSSKVESNYYPVLDSVVMVLDEYSNTYVDIIGHTDSKGSEQYNKRLSEERAKSVARYLESRAVIPERVIAEGMGEADPIASNDTREGRATNRRLEIKLKPVT